MHICPLYSTHSFGAGGTEHERTLSSLRRRQRSGGDPNAETAASFKHQRTSCRRCVLRLEPSANIDHWQRFGRSFGRRIFVAQLLRLDLLTPQLPSVLQWQ